MNGATTRAALYGSALLVVVLLAGLLWYLAPLRPSALSLQFAATPQAFGAIVHTWPPEHLERYRLHLLIDGALLLAYGVFGYLFAMRQGLMAPNAHGCAPPWLGCCHWPPPATPPKTRCTGG